MAENTPKESWDATANILIGSSPTHVVNYDTKTPQYSRLIGIKHNDPFNLTPIKITTGVYKNSYALVLIPVFRFMDLPPEIRSMVYSYLFEEEAPIELCTWNLRAEKPILARADIFDKSKRRKPRYKTHSKENITQIKHRFAPMNLFSMSRQIYREAAPILYGNTFSFSTIDEMGDFLAAIGSLVNVVKHIRVTEHMSFWGDDYTAAFHHLRDAFSLRTIELNHDLLCNNTERTFNEVGIFVDEIAPAMISLQNRHDSKNTAICVPQIFGVIPDIWGNCLDTKEADERENNDHCEEITEYLRSTLAKALGVGTKKSVE